MTPFLDSLRECHLDRILLAAVFGAIIGWEREQHGRPAGLRTHMLVCIGAALMMVVSESMFTRYRGMVVPGDTTLRVDPGRIAAQIITGIGFLGAGVIMKVGARVQGLTTAACLWLIAGVGMAAGSGQQLLAFVSTLISAFVLYYLGKMEKAIARDIHKTLVVWVKDNPHALKPMQALLKEHKINPSRYTYEEKVLQGLSIYTFNVKMRDADVVMPTSHAIREKIPNVTLIRWD